MGFDLLRNASCCIYTFLKSVGRRVYVYVEDGETQCPSRSYLGPQLAQTLKDQPVKHEPDPAIPVSCFLFGLAFSRNHTVL